MVLHKLVLTVSRVVVPLTDARLLKYFGIFHNLITESSVLMRARYKCSVTKYTETQEDSMTLVVHFAKRMIGSNILPEVNQC